MNAVKQVYQVFAEKGIRPTDPLAPHVEILHQVLRPLCFGFARRYPVLEESYLDTLFRDTAAYLMRRFEMQDIDVKGISIESSEPVIQKYISSFLFIFQRRMVYRIKRLNRYLELLVEMLEEFEKNGIEELDREELDKLGKALPTLLDKERVTHDQELILEFLFAKFNTWLNEYKDIVAAGNGASPGNTGENSIARVKRLLKEKRESNRRALAGILLEV